MAELNPVLLLAINKSNIGLSLSRSVAVFSQGVSFGNSRSWKARVADFVDHGTRLCHLLQKPGTEQKEKGVRTAVTLCLLGLDCKGGYPRRLKYALFSCFDMSITHTQCLLRLVVETTLLLYFYPCFIT